MSDQRPTRLGHRGGKSKHRSSHKATTHRTARGKKKFKSKHPRQKHR